MGDLQGGIRLLLVQDAAEGRNPNSVHARTLAGLKAAGHDVTVCPSVTAFQREYMGDTTSLDQFDAIVVDYLLDGGEYGMCVAKMIQGARYGRPVVGIANTDWHQAELREAGCTYANTPFSTVPGPRLVASLVESGDIAPVELVA